MMLLDGKRILVTGVLTPASIAFSVASIAQEQGAEILLTSFGRARRLTERTAERLRKPVDILELDAERPEDFVALAEQLRSRWPSVDGALHSIAFGPPGCFGDFLGTTWEDASTALHVSAFSLKALATTIAPMMSNGGSIVGLDFDGTVVWPGYDWMGVAKAALESTSRYLAAALGPRGIRVNLVSAGPVRTFSSRAVAGIDEVAEGWDTRAPLGWDASDPDPVAKTCIALLSSWLPATTGTVVFSDGGAHVLGGPVAT